MRARTAGLVIAGSLVSGTTVAAATVMLSAYQSGFRSGDNTPWIVASLVLAVLTTAGGAALIHRQQQGVARWLGATAGALLLYLIASALAVRLAGAAGHRDLVAQSAVQVQLVGHILPVVLLQATFLFAAEHLTGRRSRPLRIVFVLFSTVYAAFDGLTSTAGTPYEFAAPVTVADIEAWSWLAAVPWMATVVIGPVVVWRSLAQARDRQRALVVGVVSVVPLFTILCCVLSALLAFGLGILSPTAGEAVVAVAFGVPFVVSSAGLLLAWGPTDRIESLRLTPARMRLAMTVAIGLSFAIVVVTASAIVGEFLGAGALLPVVLGTLIVAAVLTPVRRRLVRALLLRADPGRARAARLVKQVGERSDPGMTAQRILQEALGDPSARLVVDLPHGGRVNAEGNQVDGSPDVFTMAADRRALLAHSPAVVDASGALEEVRSLIGLAVLEAAVRDQAGRLAAEHDRAEAAASTERRRLERDLHDGVQGRLLALALDLRMAQRELGDASAQLVLSDAATALASAIDELRTLAAGSTPELLSREGLQAALSELIHRMPLPIALSTPPGRLPPQVETVAYLVVCEAITNTMKHAEATAVSVDVQVSSGAALIVVSDDGCGGADLRAGTGLRGLSERVSSAGGSMVVSDRRPTGTTLEVTLPCG